MAHRLGNTPEMIHKVYGHLMEDMKIESVSAFSQSLQNVASGSWIGRRFVRALENKVDKYCHTNGFINYLLL